MISNIYNLLRDVGDGNAEIAVVANGSGVRHFAISSLSRKTLERLERLKGRGVRFYVCRNSLRAQGLREEDVPGVCEIVPAGVTLLVELQREGYAYIKP